jgi:cell division protein FtsB
MSTKTDTSTVYEMFETQKSELAELKKLIINTAIPTEKNEEAKNAITHLLERVVEEVKKPAKVEHRHTIDVRDRRILLSWLVFILIIFGLSWWVGNLRQTISDQRQTIVQYSNNDLKFRYIRMQGQTNEENLFRLQQQFQYGDSIRIIRNRVREFERLVREQAERMERARINEVERERLQREVDNLRGK